MRSARCSSPIPETSPGPDNNPIYLIFDTTVPGMPREPCVNPPADRKAKFAEAMADFGARKDEQKRLTGELNIAKPYRYVNGTEMPDEAIRGQATDFFSVGNVYFDRDHTVAGRSPGEFSSATQMATGRNEAG
jgi:hypothetical protein